MVNSAGSFKPSWVHSVASNGVMSERGWMSGTVSVV